MELIGITGKLGSGKTTFSDYLARNSADIGVIHVDDIIAEEEKKYITIERRRRLQRNRLANSVYMKSRTKRAENIVDEKLQELADKRIVLIDDIFIANQNIYNVLSRVYILDRPYRERRIGIIEKSRVITESDIREWDNLYHLIEESKMRNDGRIIRISNEQAKIDLKDKARELYNKTMISDREKLLKRTKAKNIIRSKKAKERIENKVKKSKRGNIERD